MTAKYLTMSIVSILTVLLITGCSVEKNESKPAIKVTKNESKPAVSENKDDNERFQNPDPNDGSDDGVYAEGAKKIKGIKGKEAHLLAKKYAEEGGHSGWAGRGGEGGYKYTTSGTRDTSRKDIVYDAPLEPNNGAKRLDEAIDIKYSENAKSLDEYIERILAMTEGIISGIEYKLEDVNLYVDIFIFEDSWNTSSFQAKTTLLGGLAQNISVEADYHNGTIGLGSYLFYSKEKKDVVAIKLDKYSPIIIRH